MNRSIPKFLWIFFRECENREKFVVNTNWLLSTGVSLLCCLWRVARPQQTLRRCQMFLFFPSATILHCRLLTSHLPYLENESPATWPAGLAQVAHVDPSYLIWKYIVMNTPPTLRVSRKLLTSVLDCATVTCYCPFPWVSRTSAISLPQHYSVDLI